MKQLAWFLVALFPLVASPSALAVDAESLTPVSVELLSAPGKKAQGLKGLLRLTPSTPDSLEPVVMEIAPNGSTPLQLPRSSRWTLEVVAPGYWTPARVLSVPKDSPPITERVPIWPIARLVGRVQGEDGSPIRRLSVTFEPEPGSSSTKVLGRSRAECEVSEEGEFTCKLPATPLDLALRANGFVPHYQWGVALSAEEVQDLGKLRLSAGSSVAGRVDVAEGIFKPKECVVRLVPLQGPGAASPRLERVKQSASTTAQVAENGFFQIPDAAPGVYLLEVEHPGFAPARMAPVELMAGAETSLKEAVVLERPLTLTLAITPALSPAGKPWFVRVRRAFDYSSRFDGAAVFDGVATASGEVQVLDQSPGRFAVDVAAGRGYRYYSNSALFVTSAADAHHDIRLDLVELTGRVTFGGKPLVAKLYFGTRNGGERVEVESDSKGEFSGVLPREGSWRLDVDATEPELRNRMWVAVDRNRDGEAYLEVDLPDTEISGVVLDPQERPVARANVDLQGTGESLSTRTDGEGRFLFRAFEEGSVALSATARRPEGALASAQVMHEVVEGIPAGPAEIRLEAKRTIRGSIVSHLGAVVGASVHLQTLDSPVPAAHSVRTDLEGQFTAQLPERAKTLQITVSPPGGALQSFVVEAAETLPPLSVLGAGGTLQVEMVSEATPPPLLVIEQEGLVLPLGEVIRWAQGHQGGPMGEKRNQLLAPKMGAGSYRVCMMSPQAMRRAGFETGNWRTGLENCETGYLSEGGELVFRLLAENTGEERARAADD